MIVKAIHTSNNSNSTPAQLTARRSKTLRLAAFFPALGPSSSAAAVVYYITSYQITVDYIIPYYVRVYHMILQYSIASYIMLLGGYSLQRGCSGRGVQWMGVVLDKLVYDIIKSPHPWVRAPRRRPGNSSVIVDDIISQHMLKHSILHDIMLHCSIEEYNILEQSRLCYVIVQCSTVQYSIVQHSVVQYSIAQHSIVQYGRVQYSIVEQSTCHIILQHTPRRCPRR